MLDYLLILLLSHFLTDFVFQTETRVANKHSSNKKLKHKSLLLHSAIFFVTSAVLFWLIQRISWVILSIIFILMLIHYALDLLKANIIIVNTQAPIVDICEGLNKPNSKENFKSNCPVWLFLVDQIAHIFFIVVLTQIAFRSPWYEVLAVGTNNSLVLSPFTIIQKVLLTACILILTTSFANILIKISLSFIKLQTMTNEKELKIGRYIGAIERILTIIAIVTSTYEAVAILYASKTAVRFSQIQNNPEFSDYYMLGTLASALFGIVGGILIKIIILN